MPEANLREGGTMKQTLCVFVILLAALLGKPCSAKKEHAPLNPKVIAAKSVYIENHGNAKVADKAYEELKKWGRWEIVQDRTKADLVFALSSEEGHASSGTTQTYDPNMKTGTMTTGGWKYGTVNESTSGSVHMELLDPKSGDSLYADTGTKLSRVIRELQKRVEAVGKSSK